MSKEQEHKSACKVQDNNSFGEVRIADDVVATIAALAATEVEGVAAMVGNITNELINKLGMKNLAKGVKVIVTPQYIIIDLTLILKYGYNIPKTSKQVQEKVKAAVESMLGLAVEEVNIRISGINIENSK